jgi:hypothetical protein
MGTVALQGTWSATALPSPERFSVYLECK